MGIPIKDFTFHNADGTPAGYLARGQYEVLRRDTFSELEEMLVQHGSAYKLMRRLPVSRGCRRTFTASGPRANPLQLISRWPDEYEAYIPELTEAGLCEWLEVNELEAGNWKALMAKLLPQYREGNDLAPPTSGSIFSTMEEGWENELSNAIICDVEEALIQTRASKNPSYLLARRLARRILHGEGKTVRTFYVPDEATWLVGESWGVAVLSPQAAEEYLEQRGTWADLVGACGPNLGVIDFAAAGVVQPVRAISTALDLTPSIVVDKGVVKILGQEVYTTDPELKVLEILYTAYIDRMLGKRTDHHEHSEAFANVTSGKGPSWVFCKLENAYRICKKAIDRSRHDGEKKGYAIVSEIDVLNKSRVDAEEDCAAVLGRLRADLREQSSMRRPRRRGA
jgi:hypothetical protein